MVERRQVQSYKKRRKKKEKKKERARCQLGPLPHLLMPFASSRAHILIPLCLVTIKADLVSRQLIDFIAVYHALWGVRLRIYDAANLHPRCSSFARYLATILFKLYWERFIAILIIFQDGRCKIVGAIAPTRRADKRLRAVRSSWVSDGPDSIGPPLLQGSDFGLRVPLPGGDADRRRHAFGGVHLLRPPREAG